MAKNGYNISMLTKLKVLDFAIIEDIEIEFNQGLTVLTGETGAGKSLIIDCIGLLLGERASLEMVRQYKDGASVIGYFDNDTPQIRAFLEKRGIPFDGKIKIVRYMSKVRSILKINNYIVTRNDLKAFGTLLADIHLQFDMVKLFVNDNYLSMVDGFSERLVNEYLDKYVVSLNQLKEQERVFKELVQRIEDFNEHQEEYDYAYHEISALHLNETNEQETENRNNETINEYEQTTKLEIQEQN